MVRTLLPSALLLTLGVAPAAGQLSTPSDWRWRTDRPARLVEGQGVSEDAWQFVGMPPGWHVTMGPGGVLYHPDYRTQGRFEISSEMVLFPDASESGYGIMFGAEALAGSQPSYMSFLVRRDGAYTLTHTLGTEIHTILEWTPSPAVQALPAEGTVTNTLSVEATASELILRVNGTEVSRMDKGPASTEGLFGFRIGRG